MFPRVLRASVGKADSCFRVVVESVVRYLAAELVGPRCASPGTGRACGAIHATFSGGVAAAGRADCVVSGFAGGADPGGFHVPRASRRGRQVGTGASRFAGRSIGAECGPATLGPKRQGACRISIRPWKYGQESILDVFSWRRLL